MDANTKFAPVVADSFLTPNTGVAETFHFVKGVQQIRMTLTNFVVPVLAANDYGGTKLCDLPPTNLLLFALEVNLITTKGGVTNGLVAATDIAMSIGTVTASSTTLNSTMANAMASQAITADLLTNALQVHTLATTPAELGILDGAPTAALFLNVAAAAGITADDVLTVNGTIDIFILDLGNVTSPG